MLFKKDKNVSKKYLEKEQKLCLTKMTQNLLFFWTMGIKEKSYL